MLVVVPTSTGNAWRVAGNVEDDDLRDRREGEVGGVTVEDMKTMIWQTMIGLLDSMVWPQFVPLLLESHKSKFQFVAQTTSNL